MVEELRLDYTMAAKFVGENELEQMEPKVQHAHELLHLRTGAGREYTGWLEDSLADNQPEMRYIRELSGVVRNEADVFVVIGVGGSYLGSRATLGLLNHSYYNQLSPDRREGPEIYFAGQNLSPVALTHLLEIIRDKELFVNVISKSGTTLEPALAFRTFRQLLEERYGKEGARQRIIVTTDTKKGALRRLAEEENYAALTIPGDIGGRNSVLTAAGLLPMAVGGIAIEEILAGARQGCHLYRNVDLFHNPSYLYATLRHLLYRKGKTIELLAYYEPSFYYLAEWWKQLFGESEGKEGKGIFPGAVSFTTDLHSLGQYLQEGMRQFFTTTLWVDQIFLDRKVDAVQDNWDGLGFLNGKTMQFINEKACQGTMEAHSEGGLPALQLTMPRLTPYYVGQLLYFFQKACAISGYLLGVNPFDQPGVEAYKRNMFSLLERESTGEEGIS